MPRHPRSRSAAQVVFPREDGASASTGRNPQLLALPRERDQQQQPQQQHEEQDEGTRGREAGDEMMPRVSEEQQEQEEGLESFEDGLDEEMAHQAGEGDGEGAGEAEGDVDPDATDDDARFSSAPIPPNLREISSLASWTVSTHKPGCGVSALRNPSPSFFWQSDGPQPHTLTLHFFKRIAIVRLRVYLDFELDESYTPTKMVFLAGMGGNDLVEFATWQDESPCGWVDINLEGVGGSFTKPRRRKGSRGRRARKSTVHGAGQGEADSFTRRNGNVADLSDIDTSNWNDGDDGNGLDGEDDSEEEFYEGDIDLDDPSAGNVLKAMVLQMRICENHQNGKDTHVRGLQVFARDDRYFTRMRHKQQARGAAAEAAHGDNGATAKDLNAAMADVEHEGAGDVAPLAKFDEEDWLQEPEIR